MIFGNDEIKLNSHIANLCLEEIRRGGNGIKFPQTLSTGGGGAAEEGKKRWYPPTHTRGDEIQGKVLCKYGKLLIVTRGSFRRESSSFPSLIFLLLLDGFWSWIISSGDDYYSHSHHPPCEFFVTTFVTKLSV